MNQSDAIEQLTERLAAMDDYLRHYNDIRLLDDSRRQQVAHSNPLNGYGKKCYSQTDEDGITIEILRRIGCLDHGTFAEYGVGDGTENNTLVLAALGWRGFWVGGQTLRPAINEGRGERFQYAKVWITLANIIETTRHCLERIKRQSVDVISLDLDGNDIHFIRALLQAGLRPKLFIAEYNAKFLPPTEFEIAYDAEHVWQKDDYFGASLTSLDKLFQSFGYRLICCNSHSGANAFFVDQNYAHCFQDVPEDIRQIHVSPRYALYRQYGHKVSLRTIEHIFDLIP
jgi:hypothetical protein